MTAVAVFFFVATVDVFFLSRQFKRSVNVSSSYFRPLVPLLYYIVHSNGANQHGFAFLQIDYLLNQISSDIPHQLEHVIVVKASIGEPKGDVLETRWVFAVRLEHRYFPFLQTKRCANVMRNILNQCRSTCKQLTALVHLSDVWKDWHTYYRLNGSSMLWERLPKRSRNRELIDPSDTISIHCWLEFWLRRISSSSSLSVILMHFGRITDMLPAY